jgi:hypothetical protein
MNLISTPPTSLTALNNPSLQSQVHLQITQISFNPQLSLASFTICLARISAAYAELSFVHLNQAIQVQPPKILFPDWSVNVIIVLLLELFK